MGLLGKACGRLLKRLSCGCSKNAVVTSPQTDTRCSGADQVLSTAPAEPLQSGSLASATSTADCVVVQEIQKDSWLFPQQTSIAGRELDRARAEIAAKVSGLGVRNLTSEADSGVCMGEDVVSECGDEDEDYELEWSEDEEEECECEECVFARCQDRLEDWHVSAKDLTLDKVISSDRGEVTYSGYWHGSVTVHRRQSTQQTALNFYIEEAHTLSKIRHENIQLFLGVCLDLQRDSVALVMSDIKGESLHTLLHKRNREFTFADMTKYINQIAQGMAYLHDRGIAHPLLTSKCISVQYRACISMLSPAFCSNSVESSQLVYMPPEVIRTLHPSTLPTSHTHSTLSQSLTTDPANQDSTDANVFSFGTIVYEMVTMSLPFYKTPGELIIWEVGNNHCQSLSLMHDGKLKDIVQACWFPNPELRPSFKELLGTLEQNMSPRACGLTAYFSFSDPGRLAKTGLY